MVERRQRGDGRNFFGNVQFAFRGTGWILKENTPPRLEVSPEEPRRVTRPPSTQTWVLLRDRRHGAPRSDDEHISCGAMFGLLLGVAAVGTGPLATSPLPKITRDLRAFWAFQEDSMQPRVDSVNGYVLSDHNASNPAPQASDSPGLFGPYSVSLDRQMLVAPRSTVPGIVNISGSDATVTIAAWIKLGHQQGGGFVGGVWEESDAWRQFGLFLDHTARCPTPNGLVAHISGAGGPENGRPYCESAACGTTNLGDGAWHCVANVYDGHDIMAYVDGVLDNSGKNGTARNPFKYPNPPSFPIGGIFTPPPNKGANLSVGANLIHPGGGIGPSVLGNTFIGQLGGLAIYGTALTSAEMGTLCDQKRA
eukprot:m.190660 g.190660  ORF g.190660 m.190660 type:complete len:365 (+) comp15130_c0_seq1:1692-2786(+)